MFLDAFRFPDADAEHAENLKKCFRKHLGSVPLFYIQVYKKAGVIM